MTGYRSDFPVVGIGASAGGLSAFKTLLQNLPKDTGAAYILVPHLDPDHESMMAGLLDRHTPMRVVQANDDMTLEPNIVYIIRPGRFIRLHEGRLFLDEPVQERGIRLSIDYFLRSLAEVQGKRSTGIILSGTGADGTAGIKEIAAVGGMVLVQKPDEAEHSGMPASAIATGCVDFVLDVAEMGAHLSSFFRHPYLRGAAHAEMNPGEACGLDAVIAILRAQTTHDFGSYKRGTVQRRIQRRIAIHQMGSLEEYVAFLRETPEEVSQLFRDLLIGVTRFFREPKSWDAFGETLTSCIIPNRQKTTPLRAWVPGCASGEEAYTLAITLFEKLEQANRAPDVQIFATDLNETAIEIARTGRYPLSIESDVPARLLDKYFVREPDHYHVNKRLREAVVFAMQNVVSDPPFSKLDIITCRNLMIYLEADVQQRLVEMFHFALVDGGCLMLGNSETVDRAGPLFKPIRKSHRIFSRADVLRKPQKTFPIVDIAPSPKAGKAQAAQQAEPARDEVMRINEALQNSNEELETSREELQSLNEELSTLNGQLEEKLEEVERINTDLTNLLASTRIAVLFLDTDMIIRRFTPPIREMMRIIDTDIGRPVEDIALRVNDTTFLKDARRCLETRSEQEKVVRSEEDRDLIRRIQPYRASDDGIEGVAVTYTDVTMLRLAGNNARHRERRQHSVVELGGSHSVAGHR